MADPITDPFLARASAMYEQLQSQIDIVKNLFLGQEIDEGQLPKISTLLDTSIKRFVTEVHFYMEKSSNVSLEWIARFTTTQLEAEKWHTELSSLLNDCTKKQDTTKLPKLELPKFSGDILKFYNFWDRFEANIANKKISDADKLAYLLGCLEGPALEALEGLESNNNNYKIAKDILKKRFGQKEILIDAHYRELNNVPKAENNASQCRKTLSSIERHLRILQSLGESVDGNQFRAIILSKFPEHLIYELKLMLRENTMSNIRIGLEKIITAMEQSITEVTHSTPHENTATALHVGDNTRTQKRPTFKKQQNKEQQRGPSRIAQKRKFISNQIEPKRKKVKKECIFCNGDHYNGDCTEIKTIEERRRKLDKRCYRCFKQGHQTRSCPSKKLCYHCKGNHNQALCPKHCKTTSQTITNVTKETTCNLLTANSFLQTAVVRATNCQPNPNKIKHCRVLLDSGSQRSYITASLAKELHLETVQEDTLMIYVFGADKPNEINSSVTEVKIETKRGISKIIKVNIVPFITEKITSAYNLRNFSVDVIADNGSAGPGIDLLIGNDYYFSFLRPNIVKLENNLYLIDTDFGWMVTGQIIDKSVNTDVLSMTTYCQHGLESPSCYTTPDLPLRDADVRFLWALENLGITDSPKVTREEEAVKQFNETITYENHRYYVSWPWITYPPEIPTNFGLAYGRLFSMVQRLEQDAKQEYNAILQEQLKLGVIELIEPEPIKIYQTTPPIHYLPHHLIKQVGKKGRIVYDASAKLKDNRSLNECLYRGPSMLEDLTALLLKFRLHKIGITADVEKAFLQVGLQEEARDVTRFLWLRDISKGVSEENIIHLRFCRVPFGIISSPFLLTATIRHHLLKTNESLLRDIMDCCYVDNLVTGANTIEEGFSLINKTRSVFNELSMNIREWTSNDKKLMNKTPTEYRGKDKEEVKVLGLIWNLQNDTLRLKENCDINNEVNLKKNKRELLKILASLYDPCGYVAPLVLPAKLLIQELWRRKIKWDTALPSDLEEQWKIAVKTLQNAKEIEVKRYVGDLSTKEYNCELHCFTDASKIAYAAVVYLRILNMEMRTSRVVFIMAKSRIAPIEHKEDLKIPRLELLGCVIGKRLLTYVENVLRLNLKRICLWTDSEIVLHWLRSEKLLPPFVSRRICEIKENKNIEHLYVNTNQNPADVATRPELWEQKKELWYNGPDFMKSFAMQLPSQNVSCLAMGGMDQEEKSIDPEHTIDENMPTLQNRDQEEMDIDQKIIIEETNNDDSLMLQSELTDVKELQKLYFPDETAGKETHLKRNLQLFTDVDGVLRCKGRIMNAVCSYDTKHPILIPKDCEFTNKLIQKVHTQNHHVGAAHTLSLIRQKYWIPQGKSKAQRIIKGCPQCVKHGGGPYKLPPTPALPSERVNYSAPFTYTGIDYFGPMYVNEKRDKRWICLYTCLAVRAIHMEVVKDLTAEECILALRRFISIRGLPDLIVSDNALQFKLSAEVLTDPYCTENRIRWKFIPQLSPWHGGFYERLVGLVKNCLKRTLEKQTLNDTQLQTIIKEVEAVINTRPLTCVGSEMEYVLKPVDFLTFSKCITITPITQKDSMGGTVTKQNLIEGWKKGFVILEQFKNMFIGQYLTSLRERYSHSPKQPRIRSDRTPKKGDTVQLKGESKNRENWKVGTITSLIPGPDGEIRVARVMVGGKEFTRSIGHLYPLEVEHEENTDSRHQESKDTSSIPPNPVLSDRTSIQESDNNTYLEKQADENEQPNRKLIEQDIDIGEVVNENCERREITQNESPIEETSTPVDIQVVEDISENRVEENDLQCEERIPRAAAIRAREKIAQIWSNQLAALL